VKHKLKVSLKVFEESVTKLMHKLTDEEKHQKKNMRKLEAFENKVTRQIFVSRKYEINY
jgi:hypothetical protein